MEEKIVKYIKVVVILGVFIYIFVSSFIKIKNDYDPDELIKDIINENFSDKSVNELLEKIDVHNMIYYQKDTLNIYDIAMSDKLAIASKNVSIIELTINNSHYGKYYYMMESNDLKKQYNLLFNDEYDSLSFKNGSISWNYIDGDYYSNDYHNDVKLEKIEYIIKNKNIDNNKLNIEIVPYLLKDNGIYDIYNNLIIENSDEIDVNNYELDHYVFTFVNKEGVILFNCVNKIKMS